MVAHLQQLDGETLRDRQLGKEVKEFEVKIESQVCGLSSQVDGTASKVCTLERGGEGSRVHWHIPGVGVPYTINGVLSRQICGFGAQKRGNFRPERR